MPRAKIPDEVRNREHPKWNAGNQHYREQGGALRGTGLNNLFVHFTELACSPTSFFRLEHRKLASDERMAIARGGLGDARTRDWNVPVVFALVLNEITSPKQVVSWLHPSLPKL